MEHNKEFVEQLVQRYIKGKATDEELEVFFQLLKEGKLDDTLHRYMDHEIISMQREPAGRRRVPAQVFRKNWVRIAATVSIFFLASFALTRYNKALFNLINPVKYVRVQTVRTEVKKIALADGSTVWLNAGSRLEYPESFRGKTREVKLLEGEAFFTVSHDAGKPFIVRAGGIRTQVPGAEFNVRSYTGFEHVQVTVAQGKVAVKKVAAGGAQQTEAILEANDQVNIDKVTGVLKKTRVKAEEATGWREGKLFFNNERFADVAAILANRFDVHIEFADPAIQEYRFSAAFQATDDLPVVFEALSMANDLDYTVHNDTVTLDKNSLQLKSSQ